MRGGRDFSGAENCAIFRPDSGNACAEFRTGREIGANQYLLKYMF
jgi:hypothetical protein